jgi:hypothetical protein
MDYMQGWITGGGGGGGGAPGGGGGGGGVHPLGGAGGCAIFHDKAKNY